MSDIKLFRLGASSVSELSGGSMALEKSLQTLFEQNLESLLGVRFLASEFPTEGGRMDTLGIDENNTPVVIEYKRSTNENVINQGLFYLHWLVSHRKDFEWLVMERFGSDAAKSVDWNAPRLICIAGDFTKFDEHAVQQMNRDITLIRYRRFEGELLLLEQLTAVSAKATPNGGSSSTAVSVGGRKDKTITAQLAEAPQEVSDLYHAVEAHLRALGDDVDQKVTDFYVAFRRIKNFACVEVRNQAKKVIVFVKVNPDTVVLEKGFTRDVRRIGHFGTGDLEITIHSPDDLERAKPLFERSYTEA
ncbi:DUF5655 domain-containing protein [Sphingomonas kaistensis]|uniref:DUF5655 domain-containing protein n=1 Tax=Sphingomonas kaistensis TaxID=298708 RepID=A0ABZ2FXB6_9SPHN